MSDTVWIGVAVAGVTGAYALVSRRLAGTPLSAPMVFVGFGVALGPAGLGLMTLHADGHTLRALVEAALTLVLFTDAAQVRLGRRSPGAGVPARLLSVGLLLTIGAGWLAAWPLLPGPSMSELALVAVILAPTDAALGKDAISDPRVPALVRQGLNVESGLNDGMVLPFFVLLLAATPGTSYAQEGMGGTFWRALLLSPLLGLAVGALGGMALAWSAAHGWVAREWQQLFVPAAAVGAYEVATVTQGSGFIAAWAAGLAFAWALRGRSAPGEVERTTRFTDDLGTILALLSLLCFGAVLLGPALQQLSWRVLGYAVLSLTVVRMLPVAVALLGTRLRPATVLYMGWFGPRGLASVVFGLLVAEEHVRAVELVGQVVAVTVGLSVLLHGVSAGPLAARYGRWYRRAAASEPGLPETAAVEERVAGERTG